MILSGRNLWIYYDSLDNAVCNVFIWFNNCFSCQSDTYLYIVWSMSSNMVHQSDISGASLYHRQIVWVFFNNLFKLQATKAPKYRRTGPLGRIYRCPMDFPHKMPVMRKAFPCNDAMLSIGSQEWLLTRQSHKDHGHDTHVNTNIRLLMITSQHKRLHSNICIYTSQIIPCFIHRRIK